MKRRFFLVFFTVFLRLQIYEAIAAIIWQSASYVFSFFHQSVSFITESLYMVSFELHQDAKTGINKKHDF